MQIQLQWDCERKRKNIPGLSKFGKTTPEGGSFRKKSILVRLRPRSNLFYSKMVRLGTLNTNNWASLLRFRQQFREADLDVTTNSEGTSTASSGESTNGTGSDTVTDGSEPATGNPGAAHEISSRTVAHQIIHVKNRPLPPETRAAIRQQANSGLGARKVAHRYGVHENTVRAIWREHPRPKQRGPHRFTEEDCQRAEALLAQGRTLIEIGLELGFDRSTVRKHLGYRANQQGPNETTML